LRCSGLHARQVGRPLQVDTESQPGPSTWWCVCSNLAIHAIISANQSRTAGFRLMGRPRVPYPSKARIRARIHRKALGALFHGGRADRCCSVRFSRCAMAIVGTAMRKVSDLTHCLGCEFAGWNQPMLRAGPGKPLLDLLQSLLPVSCDRLVRLSPEQNQHRPELGLMAPKANHGPGSAGTGKNARTSPGSDQRITALLAVRSRCLASVRLQLDDSPL